MCCLLYLLSFSIGQHKSWIEVEAKKKAQYPDPGKYTIKEKVVNKLKFLKGKRVTEIQEVIKRNAWKLPPGAHFKETPQGSKLRKGKGLIDTKEPQVAYMGDAIAQGQATPGHEYKVESILTQKRPLFGSFAKGIARKDLKVGRTPATLKDYEHVDAFNKTQVKSRVCLFHKTQHKRFTERAALSKSFVPGVGAYEKIESGFNRLSPKPRALRRSRR